MRLGDAKKLSDLVFLAAGSKPETALFLLRSCVQLLEQTHKKMATSSSGGACNPIAGAAATGYCCWHYLAIDLCKL